MSVSIEDREVRSVVRENHANIEELRAEVSDLRKQLAVLAEPDAQPQACTCTGPPRDAHDKRCPVRVAHPRVDLGDAPLLSPRSHAELESEFDAYAQGLQDGRAEGRLKGRAEYRQELVNALTTMAANNRMHDGMVTRIVAVLDGDETAEDGEPRDAEPELRSGGGTASLPKGWRWSTSAEPKIRDGLDLLDRSDGVRARIVRRRPTNVEFFRWYAWGVPGPGDANKSAVAKDLESAKAAAWSAVVELEKAEGER